MDGGAAAAFRTNSGTGLLAMRRPRAPGRSTRHISEFARDSPVYVKVICSSDPCGADHLPIAPEFAQRLRNYRIDEQAREVLRRLAPLVAPVIGPALDQVIAAAAKMSRVSALWQQHGAEIRQLEMAQFDALLRAEFDDAYLETSRATAERETDLGFEGRARIHCGVSVIQMASQDRKSVV